MENPGHGFLVIIETSDPVATAPGTDFMTIGVARGEFSEYRIRAHRRVLTVRSGFTFKRQSLFEIKRNDRIARELQQEISQCSDCDRVRSSVLLIGAQVGMPRLYLCQSVRFQPID